MATPRQGRLDGPVCRIELFEPWVIALDGLDRYERIEVIYYPQLLERGTQSTSWPGLTHGCPEPHEMAGSGPATAAQQL
jgi:tRNA (adenine37-N6)-methyltransferase